MNFKRPFTYFFDKWWRPVTFLLFTALLLVITNWIDILVLQIPAFLFFCAAVVALGFSLIYQLWNRRWLYSILTFLILGGTIAASIFSTLVVLFIAMDTPDTFADNLKIPDNVLIWNPVDMDFDERRPDSISNQNKQTIDFQLYNSFQPGLYEYDFWTSKIDSGTIYIKAYEITKNHPLSTQRLPKSSSVKIYNPTDSIVKFCTANHFTIYEGDWGKPYAARFEVWHKSSTDGQERKLFEKNYKIEGWMR